MPCFPLCNPLQPPHVRLLLKVSTAKSCQTLVLQTQIDSRSRRFFCMSILRKHQNSLLLRHTRLTLSPCLRRWRHDPTFSKNHLETLPAPHPKLKFIWSDETVWGEIRCGGHCQKVRNWEFIYLRNFLWQWFIWATLYLFFHRVSICP